MAFYDVARAAVSIYMRILYDVEIVGKENVPKSGNYIICSNHKTQLDPVALSLTTKRHLYFMAKRELFEKNWIFTKILRGLGAFPVDREIGDIGAVKNALKVLREGNMFAMFPEGTRTEKMDLSKAKAGISMISLKSRSPIVPVYISSEYKFRKPLKITIGEPFDFSEHYAKKLSPQEYRELSKEILKKIYELE